MLILSVGFNTPITGKRLRFLSLITTRFSFRCTLLGSLLWYLFRICPELFRKRHTNSWSFQLMSCFWIFLRMNFFRSWALLRGLLMKVAGFSWSKM